MLDSRGVNRWKAQMLSSSLLCPSFFRSFSWLCFGQCLPTFVHFRIAVGCLVLLQALLSVYLGWRLRHIKDQFSIATELRLMMLATVALSSGTGFMLTFHTLLVPGDNSDDTSYRLALIVSLINFLLLSFFSIPHRF